MSKTIVSPVKKWPGSVTISDPLNISQAMAFEEAINGLQEFRATLPKYEVTDKNGNKKSVVDTLSAKYRSLLIPGICACVEKWELDGLRVVTPDNFPATPKLSSARLALWLSDEITNLYREADEIPNA